MPASVSNLSDFRRTRGALRGAVIRATDAVPVKTQQMRDERRGKGNRAFALMALWRECIESAVDPRAGWAILLGLDTMRADVLRLCRRRWPDVAWPVDDEPEAPRVAA